MICHSAAAGLGLVVKPVAAAGTVCSDIDNLLFG